MSSPFLPRSAVSILFLLAPSRSHWYCRFAFRGAFVMVLLMAHVYTRLIFAYNFNVLTIFYALEYHGHLCLFLITRQCSYIYLFTLITILRIVHISPAVAVLRSRW